MPRKSRERPITISTNETEEARNEGRIAAVPPAAAELLLVEVVAGARLLVEVVAEALHPNPNHKPLLLNLNLNLRHLLPSPSRKLPLLNLNLKPLVQVRKLPLLNHKLPLPVQVHKRLLPVPNRKLR
jgi:hypothetical protein